MWQSIWNLAKIIFGKMCKNKFNITFKTNPDYYKKWSMQVIFYAILILKVYELSERLGYSTPDYFSRIFTETMGVTPKNMEYNFFFMENTLFFMFCSFIACASIYARQR